MSHQLDERIRDHAAALDRVAPPIHLDDIRVSSRGDTGRRLARPLAAAAAVAGDLRDAPDHCRSRHDDTRSDSRSTRIAVVIRLGRLR